MNSQLYDWLFARYVILFISLKPFIASHSITSLAFQISQVKHTYPKKAVIHNA